MKYILAVLIGLLLAANVALLFKQSRLESRINAVQAENSRLTQEMADRPVISAADFQQAQQRFERAETYVTAAESRLTNASALLDTLRDAAQRTTSPRTSPGVSARPVAPPNGGLETAGPNVGISDISFMQPPVRLVSSSSHTPEGQLQQRSWGPEQVLGPPNTHQAGDIPTAWAPLSGRGSGEEWLHVNYDKPVEVAQVNVRETYNAGAISKVAAVLPDGREVVVWEGTEPPAQAPVDMSFTVPAGIQASSVRVYLDRGRVPGWNEIDAIELVGRDGTRQWASSAAASSSYAEQGRGTLTTR